MSDTDVSDTDKGQINKGQTGKGRYEVLLAVWVEVDSYSENEAPDVVEAAIGVPPFRHWPSKHLTGYLDGREVSGDAVLVQPLQVRTIALSKRDLAQRPGLVDLTRKDSAHDH